MSCPPLQFLEQEVLNRVKSLIHDNGIFVLNLVCRDEQLREKVLNDLRNTFKSVVSYKLDEDVNEILYCQNIPFETNKWNKTMEKSTKHLNDILKNVDSYSHVIDTQELLQQLKICM